MLQNVANKYYFSTELCFMDFLDEVIEIYCEVVKLKLKIKPEEYPYAEIDSLCQNILDLTDRWNIPSCRKKHPHNPILWKIEGNIKRYNDVRHLIDDQRITQEKYPSKSSRHHQIYWGLNVLIEHLLELMVLKYHYDFYLVEPVDPRLELQ